ncbi:VanZ family protein [Formosa sp. S-31]|uniref:VanZ family protein n=1 Tax=Formosa sp. S-31 TaxID=2790949 RepID=UPI003EB8E4DC
MRKKGFAILLAIFYTLGLLALCLIKLGPITEHAPSNSDKIFHFLAYCLLMLVWYLAFTKSFNWSFKKALINASVFSISFGLLVEILQGTFTATRHFDMLDVLANTSGVFLTLLVLVFKQKTNYKKI